MMTKITAHTGCDGTVANSMENVRYAIASGVHFIELDVQMVEGILRISHDYPTDPAPTLKEAFTAIAASGKSAINCDLKPANIEEAVYQMAKDCGLIGRLVFSGTVSVEALAKNPQMKADVPVFLNIEEYIPDFYVNLQSKAGFDVEAGEKMAAICKQHGLSVVNIYYKALTDAMAEVFHQNQIAISVWTIDKEDELLLYGNRGLYNITTNNVKKALSLLDVPV